MNWSLLHILSQCAKNTIVGPPMAHGLSVLGMTLQTLFKWMKLGSLVQYVGCHYKANSILSSLFPTEIEFAIVIVLVYNAIKIRLFLLLTIVSSILFQEAVVFQISS